MVHISPPHLCSVGFTGKHGCSVSNLSHDLLHMSSDINLYLFVSHFSPLFSSESFFSHIFKALVQLEAPNS